MSLTRTAIHQNRITITVITLAVLAGVFAFQSIPKAQDPGFTIRAAVITTRFPGASPQRVEDLHASRESWETPPAAGAEAAEPAVEVVEGEPTTHDLPRDFVGAHHLEAHATMLRERISKLEEAVERLEALAEEEP